LTLRRLGPAQLLNRDARGRRSGEGRPGVSNPATKQLDGATLDELTTLFASTKPSPAATTAATD